MARTPSRLVPRASRTAFFNAGSGLVVADRAGNAPEIPSRSELVRALTAGEFVTHLQPQVDLRTGRVVSVEALARWDRPAGAVPPLVFIPWIERYGLMATLTEVVLADALRWCAGRTGAEGSPIAVSVNVSAAELELGLVAQIRKALERWPVAPQHLTLELTESAVTKCPSVTAEILGRLKSLGTRLSIDDFGTGHSSLDRLRRLPVDEIKIDRAFVQDMRESTDGSMIKAIAALSHNLGLTVVIEGVEQEPELTALTALGCDLAQGFFISPPLPQAAFETWLETYRNQAASREAPAPGQPTGARNLHPPLVKRNTRRLSDRLRAVTQSVTVHPTLEETLQELLGELAAELGAKFAACWINDAEREQLEPLALWSTPAPRMQALVKASRDLRYAPGHGLPGIVLDGDTVVCADAFGDDPRFPPIAATRHAGCSSVIAFPLHSNSRPIGVLEFFGSAMTRRTPRLDAALRDLGGFFGEFIRARQAEDQAASLTQILATVTSTVTHLSAATPQDARERLCDAVQSLTSSHAVLLWQHPAGTEDLIVTANSGVQVGRLRVSLTSEHSGAAAAYHAGTASFVADVPHHAVPSRRLAAAVSAASALYQPVSHQGVSVGVLAIAWNERQARLPGPTQRAVELLAQAAAPFVREPGTSHQRRELGISSGGPSGPGARA